MSSRLRVTNLPKDITCENLKELFGMHGRVTDVQLIRNGKDKSRRFGYVGFHSEEESEKALEELNKTFIRTSRIRVEFAYEEGSEKIVRSWSKYSKGSSAHKRLHPTMYDESTAPEVIKTKALTRLEQLEQKLKDDENLRDFLDIHSSKPAWANDMAFNEAAEMKTEEKLNDANWLAKKKENKDDDFSDFSEDEDAIRKEKQEKRKKKKKSKKRLFVRNLSFHCVEEDLFSFFSKFGDIKEIHLPVDDFNRFKGFAFVEFNEDEDAVKAKKTCDKTIFQGRIIHIIEAKEAPKKPTLDELPDDVKEKMSYTQKKFMKDQEKAEDDYNWNSLFIPANVALDAVADQLKVSKSDILNKEATDSLAVRMATGETAIIQQTKAFLKQQGVDVTAFQGSKKKCIRSQTSFLVKGIPYSTRKAELEKVFSPFGTISRCIIPPTKTLAIIEFENKTEAKKAFRRCAYRKFKDSPLLLEWAPLKVFSAESEKKEKSSDPTEPNQQVFVNEEETTIFVKNLNFSTTEDVLKAFFSKIGKIRKCTIPTSTRTKGEKTEILSKGYGFIEFVKSKHAKRAVRKLNGQTLEGHQLKVSVSTQVSKGKKRVQARKRKREPDEEKEVEVEAKIEKAKTKILVKNVAFEATQKELKSLFGNYGSIKTVKLPTKYGGRHRGFAFIDFLTANEAESAKNALESTHFYGRKLVLQWAKQDEKDVDSLRQQTRKKLRKTIGK